MSATSDLDATENERLFQEYLKAHPELLQDGGGSDTTTTTTNSSGGSAQTCHICGNKPNVDEMYILDECSCRLCTKCAEGYAQDSCSKQLKSHLRDLRVTDYAIGCPGTGCKGLLSLRDLQVLLDGSLYDDYMRFCADVGVYTFRHGSCPKCGSDVDRGFLTSAEHNKNMLLESVLVNCKKPKCEVQFCGCCGEEPFHWGTICSRTHAFVVYKLCQDLQRASGVRSAQDLPRPINERSLLADRKKAAAVAARSASSSRTTTTSSRSRSTNSKQSSVKGGWESGTGFGGVSRGVETSSTVDQKRAETLANDAKVTKILENLSRALPSMYEPYRIDESLCSILESSCLMPYMVQQLRNDSLMDISLRGEVYSALFGLIRSLGSHPFMIYLLDVPVSEKVPWEMLTKLHRQAEIFLKQATGDATDEEIAALGVALDIQSTFSKLQEDMESFRIRMAALRKKRETALGSGKASDQTKPKSNAQVYIEALEPLLFGETKVDYDKHRHAQQIKESVPTRKKLVRISKEISVLSTSLPHSEHSSVFFRVDEKRMDVLKILITGPVDTPYENGCFCFDAFLPANYPQKSPLCLITTTGNGSARFNPNLYKNGKVCLSLLGTWSGPGWDPKESTILQVLVSIQSLILVPDPYFNEPGYERSRGTPEGDRRSHAYNSQIRYYTVRHAMNGHLEQLDQEPHFPKVMRLHFLHKAREIRAQVKKWISDSSGQYKTQLQAEYKKLDGHLKKLERGK